jgi:pyruvyltransferase
VARSPVTYDARKMTTTNSLKVYWWNELPNFGDAMNPLLISRLFGIDVVWSDLQSADLTASGSVIQWITPVVEQRSERIAVWGSGFIFAGEPPPPADAVIYCAVRGRKSAEFGHVGADIARCDPGLLASLVITAPPLKTSVLGIVPHLNHRNSPIIRRLAAEVDARIIDVTDEPAKVIEAIAGCEFVFSTSLHGLVVADSFGIPNCWVTTHPRPFGGDWKFADYYSNWLLDMSPLDLRSDLDLRAVAGVVRGSYERPGLSDMQQSLLAAFPYAR